MDDHDLMIERQLDAEQARKDDEGWAWCEICGEHTPPGEFTSYTIMVAGGDETIAICYSCEEDPE